MHSRGHFDGIREDVPLFKKCSRFEPNSHIHDHHSALIYLKLRNDGCQKHLAQKFCEKAHCRVDSTREADGPLGHKVLRIKKPKGVITTINGWTSTRPHYDLGAKYSGSPEDILDDDVQSKYFEKHFRKHEEKIKEDYKSKIHSLKLYFEDINSKCNFTKLSQPELYAKLKYENNQLRRGTKWKNLEIISGQTSGRWIDEEQMITPLINTYASPTSVQMPSSPSNMFSKTVRTRAASQDLVYDNSRPNSQRFDYVDERVKSPKHNLKSEATTHYTIETRTPRIPDLDVDEGPVSIPRTISMKIPQLGIKLLELDALEDNQQTSSRDDPRPSHNIQSEDFSNFLKAYEELENQTRLLYQLTNEGPETFQYMTKQERINANRKNSLLYPQVKHTNSTKTKMNKNDGLADEFNRINYFYYNKGGKDGDSPQERKKLAEQMMKSRKEKYKIEKSIFETIVRGQAQKDRMEENAIDTQNIEMLKKKIEEVKSLLRRKVGLEVFESVAAASKGISRQESMASNYTNSSARSLPRSQNSQPVTASVQVSPRPHHNVQIKTKQATVVQPQKSIFQKSNHRKNHLSLDGMPPKALKPTSQVSFSPNRV